MNLLEPFEDMSDRESRLSKTRIPEKLRGWTEGEGSSGRTLAKFVPPFREVGVLSEPARDYVHR